MLKEWLPVIPSEARNRLSHLSSLPAKQIPKPGARLRTEPLLLSAARCASTSPFEVPPESTVQVRGRAKRAGIPPIAAGAR